MRYVFIALAAVVVVTMASFINRKASLTVTSTSFTNNGNIPMKYSCEGTETSPPLHIANVPANAQSLAIILHDPDADMPGGFTHWVLWNVATTGHIPEGFKGADQGFNGAKQNGYKGMCPPTGTHHYHFKVYALDTKLNLAKNTDKAGLENAIKGHVLAEGEIVGLYKKMK